MKIIQALFSSCIISSSFLGMSLIAAAQEKKTAAAPRVFIVDGRKLAETKRRIQAGDKSFTAALAKLETDARRAMQQKPLSVVTKAVAPPSGDKHDYLSQAPYFWPDPKKPGGLPYINRDGERNPELDKITDHLAMDQMGVAVRALSLACYFKDDEEYAAKATQLLRAWFLDPATRMNPHLEYAQFIPGVNTGRGIGLIETRGLVNVVDAIGLLAGSKSWTSADQKGLETWFTTFLQWMQESRNGRDENAKKNNHGTFYDVQAISFALFVRRNDLAKEIAAAAKEKRIALQIEPDGRQALELVRTKAWSYSNMNLDGLIQLARLAENVSVDLWAYETKDGRSIRRAVEYLYPYATGDRQWTYQQIGGFEAKSFFPLMRRAALHYQDQKFKADELRIPKSDPTDREHLLAGK
jgi:Alginate lyase